MNIIPRPPSDVFELPHDGQTLNHITAETNNVYKIRKIVCGGNEYAYFDYTSLPKELQSKIPPFQDLQLFQIKTNESVPMEGQFTYFQELLYPRKGFVFPEVLWQVNTVKRFTISLLQAFLVKELILSMLGFLILPWFIKKRIIENFLSQYFSFTSLVLGSYFLKDNYKMAPAKELEKWIGLFLQNLGFVPYLGKVFGMFIEYDSAYTLRFQDIMTEVIKEDLIKNPSKELGRLVKVFVERESRPHLNKKIKTIVWGLKIIFLIPRIRKAFKRATVEIDFSKLSFTEADRYECLFLGSYDFMGRTIEDRWAELEKLHNGKVPASIPVTGRFT